MADCTHSSDLKCTACRPDLWHYTQEQIDVTNRSIYQAHVVNLVQWNRAYRAGEAEVSDEKYDIYETALKVAYPDHPMFKMVGHDETKIEEILGYIPGGKNPILRK